MKITSTHVFSALLYISAILLGIKLEQYKQSAEENHQTETSLRTPRQLQRTTTKKKLTVGVYYYPWHGPDFHGGGYLREFLDPPQEPLLGEYDDTKPSVIKKHLAWSMKAGINLWVTSWWGPDTREDTTTRNVIFPAIKKKYKNMKIALHYETTGRLEYDESDPIGTIPIGTINADMVHLCKHYLSKSKYYRIDGRPVLVMYLTRLLEYDGILKEVVMNMRRSVAKECGEDLYLIGDHAFGWAPDLSDGSFMESFYYLDAITNYDVYGSMIDESSYAGLDVVNTYYSEQEKWKEAALEHGTRFIPAASPGYNDRGIRLEANHTALSRRLDEGMAEGTLFRGGLERAFHLSDTLANNLVLINSFNEWHEDTQIEPVKTAEATALPDELTNGVDYEGYGFLYLDIVKEEKKKYEGKL